MSRQVDSYQFVSGFSRRMVKAWIENEKPREIPWTPLSKDLNDCTVALISSGGVALKNDLPFDQEGERQNPWWGDPSYRIIPRDTVTSDIKVYHLHINPSYGEEDINCLLPVERLLEFERAGGIGRCAPSHYSIMGYIMQPDTLLHSSIPAIIGQLKLEEVDAVVLLPT